MCPHGDPTCPCPDGDVCHYVADPGCPGTGADPMPCPTTGIKGCTRC